MFTYLSQRRKKKSSLVLSGVRRDKPFTSARHSSSLLFLSLSSPMASLCYSLSSPSIAKLTDPKAITPTISFPNLIPNSCPRSFLKIRNPRIRVVSSKSSSSNSTAKEASNAEMSVENLHSFINLNTGKWHGSFYVSLQLWKLWLLLGFCFSVFRFVW